MKILILSASSGAGHLMAGKALEEAFAQEGTGHEVSHVDSNVYSSKLLQKLYADTYIKMANSAGHALGWFYDYLDEPWRRESRRLAFDRLNTSKLIKFIATYAPDIVLCTHFMPAEIVSWMRARRGLNCRLGIVVTDFDVHAMWLVHNYDRYFVALEESREHLVQLGIPPAQITVSGIPIRPIFAESKAKAAMRHKHGLTLDRTTILVSAGGFGVGPVEAMLTTLSTLQHPAQVLAICGKNEELRLQVEALMGRQMAHPTLVRIQAVGYTTAMDEYMAAADLLVGKPGGLTTSEALAKGLVCVIVNPIQGQEERNADHLHEEGMAIRCNNLPTLAWKIDRLLSQPARVATMQAQAQRLAKPRAAATIVHTMLTQ